MYPLAQGTEVMPQMQQPLGAFTREHPEPGRIIGNAALKIGHPRMVAVNESDIVFPLPLKDESYTTSRTTKGSSRAAMQPADMRHSAATSSHHHEETVEKRIRKGYQRDDGHAAPRGERPPAT